MIKKETLLALLLLLMIPVVMLVGGFLFSLINPEAAAGHPNYVRNWHMLNQLRGLIFFGMFATVAALYLFGSFLVIRSKSQSGLWLLLAMLGPLGFAIISALNDRAPSEEDRYSHFILRLNRFIRIGYEVACSVLICGLASQIMVLKRNLMIHYESITTGISTAQIIATQNASSGMWAFGESIEVLFFAIVLYLLRPVLFNLVARAAAPKPQPRTI